MLLRRLSRSIFASLHAVEQRWVLQPAQLSSSTVDVDQHGRNPEIPVCSTLKVPCVVDVHSSELEPPFELVNEPQPCEAVAQPTVKHPSEWLVNVKSFLLGSQLDLLKLKPTFRDVLRAEGKVR
jgi:hypothetical protein